MENLLTIKISDINFLMNVRQEFDVSELKQSIQENGLKVPLTVVRADNKFFLKYGHRRLQAMKELGYTTVPCVVEPYKDNSEFIVSQVIENVEREGLSYTELANVFSMLLDVGMSQAEISTKLGFSQAYISLSLSALNIPDKVSKAIDDGIIKPSAIRPYLSLSREDQEKLQDVVIAKKTARGIASVVHTYKALKDTDTVMSDDTDDDTNYDNQLQEHLNIALSNLRQAYGYAILFGINRIESLEEIYGAVNEFRRLQE